MPRAPPSLKSGLEGGGVPHLPNVRWALQWLGTLLVQGPCMAQVPGSMQFSPAENSAASGGQSPSAACEG